MKGWLVVCVGVCIMYIRETVKGQIKKKKPRRLYLSLAWFCHSAAPAALSPLLQAQQQQVMLPPIKDSLQQWNGQSGDWGRAKRNTADKAGEQERGPKKQSRQGLG